MLNDTVAYGRDGTTYIHKSNFTRHVNGEAHKVCLRIETGEPIDKRQKKGKNRNLVCHNF